MVAWLPSSTCPHWASKKTRMAAEARVPTPAAVAMAVTQASRLQATSPRHSPFWQLHHSQPTSILGAGFAPLHSSLCSSAQVATVTHRAVAESSWSTRNFGGCQESPSFSLTSTPFPPLLGTTRPTTALTSGQVKGELPWRAPFKAFFDQSVANSGISECVGSSWRRGVEDWEAGIPATGPSHGRATTDIGRERENMLRTFNQHFHCFVKQKGAAVILLIFTLPNAM